MACDGLLRTGGLLVNYEYLGCASRLDKPEVLADEGLSMTENGHNHVVFCLDCIGTGSWKECKQ